MMQIFTEGDRLKQKHSTIFWSVCRSRKTAAATTPPPLNTTTTTTTTSSSSAAAPAAAAAAAELSLTKNQQ